MKKLLSLLTAGTLLATLSGSLLFAVPYAAAATPTDSSSTGDAKYNVCAGIGLTDANGTCGDNGKSLANALTAAVNILSIIAGVATIIMVILAGFKFITSGGDTSKVTSAKSSLTYAIVGLVVVVLSQTLVHFVFNKVK